MSEQPIEKSIAEAAPESLPVPTNTFVYQLKEKYSQFLLTAEHFKAQFPLIRYELEEKEKNIFFGYKLFVYPPTSKFNVKNGAIYQNTSGLPITLYAQTLAKTSHLSGDIEVFFTTKNQQSPSGNLPFLLTPDGKALVDDELVSLLSSHRSELNDINSQSLIHLIHSQLGTVVKYFLFCDQEQFSKHTLPYFGQEFQWPLSEFVGYLERRKILNELLETYDVLDREDLLIGAEKTFESLVSILDVDTEEINEDNERKVNLFSGQEEPNSVDIALFSYIHIIQGTFPQNHPLKQLVKRFPLLLELSKQVYNHSYKQ